LTERRPQTIILLCAAYAVLLSIAAFSIPLRIPEILALAGARQLAPHGLLGWIAQSPELAPLFYVFQWPVALAIDNFRIGARLLPLAFAVGACYGFFHLAKQIPAQGGCGAFDQALPGVPERNPDRRQALLALRSAGSVASVPRDCFPKAAVPSYKL